MKIDQIIVLHLYKYKQVTLQGIGSFYLAPSLETPVKDATTAFADNAISFQLNVRAPEDTSLIDTIVYHTKKLKPLAAADLDSFLQWQRQLLNINLSFNLPDLGSLQKAANGQIVFVPKVAPAAPSTATAVAAKKTPVTKVIYKFGSTAIHYGKKASLIIMIASGLVLMAWLFLYYSDKSKVNKPFVQQKPNRVEVPNATPARKGVPKAARFIKTIHAPAIIDSVVFKVVFYKTPSEIDARKKLDEIYGFGHSAMMYLEDSAYTLAIPFSRPLTDTSLVKDSLNKYYSLGKGTIEAE